MRIYITGNGRSGSSWFGRMVAENEQLPYFGEPFRLNKSGDPFGLIASKQIPPPKPYNLTREYLLNHISKGIEVLPNFVIKDFWALYYTKELHDKYGFKIINIIRHPAPWTMSAMSLDVAIGFYDFIGIPTVMESIRPHLDHIYSRTDKYWIAWMSWAIRYMTLRHAAVGDWVTHEDLCINPSKAFANVGLTFNQHGKKFFDENNKLQKIKGKSVTHRLTENEPYKWFGKFDKLDEMKKALEPFGVQEWGFWGEEFWS